MAGRTPDDDSRPGLEQLLLLAGRGDVEAFAVLYDELAPRVFGLVTCVVRDPATAEKVTIEVFLEAWRRASSYDPTVSSAAAWVLALAHRLAVRVSRLSAPTTDGAHDACTDESPLLAAGLSRGQADAVHLAYFGGLDHLRIAQLLDLDEEAVVVLSAGLQQLAPGGSRR